jgi:hypothetical protein
LPPFSRRPPHAVRTLPPQDRVLPTATLVRRSAFSGET